MAPAGGQIAGADVRISLQEIERAMQRGGDAGKISTALERFKSTPRGQELVKAALERREREKARLEKRAAANAALYKMIDESRANIADIGRQLEEDLLPRLKALESYPYRLGKIDVAGGVQ